MLNFSQFDVVKVPFPFTEMPFAKRRPAVVLSNSQNFAFAEDRAKCVLAMITSSSHKPWPLDTPLSSLPDAGLSQASLVRLKLFTLDASLILAKIGRLSRKDIVALRANLTKLFAQQ